VEKKGGDGVLISLLAFVPGSWANTGKTVETARCKVGGIGKRLRTMRPSPPNHNSAAGLVPVPERDRNVETFDPGKGSSGPQRGLAGRGSFYAPLMVPSDKNCRANGQQPKGEKSGEELLSNRPFKPVKDTCGHPSEI